MNEQNSLSIDVAAEALPSAAGEAVAVCVFAGERRVADGGAAGGGASWREVCERVLAGGEFDGKEDTSLLLSARGGGGNVCRVLMLGLGGRAQFGPEELRRAASTAARAARAAGVRHLFFVPPEGAGVARSAGVVAEGVILGLYDGALYQSRDETRAGPERLTVVAPAADGATRAEVERARTVAESVNWARVLADEPGGSLPPREFARRAAAMAEECGLVVESLDAAEVRARGMGGLVGVGQGSDEEPALIVVRYEPEGARAADELWAFVGKGITFDTGGISLKRGPGMEEMKSDMAGGAAVLGALRALARLKPARRVVGVVPAAENMPSGRSVKPGDIVRTFAGHTVEVVDTDAEGRLVLVDGIAYARSLGATRIVDLATLTGSVIVALGTHRAGLFSNDDAWAARVAEAAARAGEPVWRMPVGDDYKRLIESDVADFKNYGGRPDATSAALLLSKFAADTPWAHLDIAGTAWHEEAQPHAPKGATGAGVRTLVELTADDEG